MFCFRFRPLQTAPAETVSWFVASADFCSKLSEFALNNNLVLSLKKQKKHLSLCSGQPGGEPDLLRPPARGLHCRALGLQDFDTRDRERGEQGLDGAAGGDFHG